jgi:hypothetical protein
MTRKSHVRPPATLTTLGVLHDLVVECNGRLRALAVREGMLLMGVPPLDEDDCREMYIIRPLARSSERVRRTDAVLRAVGLYERFTMREPNELYNCRIPQFHSPRYVGDMVTIRYVQEKHHGDLPKRERMQQVLWQHHFKVEEDGAAEGKCIADRGSGPDGSLPICVGDPAHVPIWQLSRDQFYVPPGAWKVTERGIMYDLPPSEQGLLDTIGGLL